MKIKNIEKKPLKHKTSWTSSFIANIRIIMNSFSKIFINHPHFTMPLIVMLVLALFSFIYWPSFQSVNGILITKHLAIHFEMICERKKKFKPKTNNMKKWRKKKMKRVQNMFPCYRFNQFLKNHWWKVINILAISNNNNFIVLRRSCMCSHYLVNTSCANVNFPRICAQQMRKPTTSLSKFNRISNKCIPNPRIGGNIMVICCYTWRISLVIFHFFQIDAMEILI